MMLNSSTSKAKVFSSAFGSNHGPARKRVKENSNHSVEGAFLRRLPNRNRGKENKVSRDQLTIEGRLEAVSVSDTSQFSASNSNVSKIFIRELPDRKRGKQKSGASNASVSFDQRIIESRLEALSVPDASHFGAPKINANDSTPKIFFRSLSHRKRNWHEMTTSTPKEEVSSASDSNQEPVRKRARTITKESSSRKSNRRMTNEKYCCQEVSTSTTNASESSAWNAKVSSAGQMVDSRLDAVSNSDTTQLDATKIPESHPRRLRDRNRGWKEVNQRHVRKRSAKNTNNSTQRTTVQKRGLQKTSANRGAIAGDPQSSSFDIPAYESSEENYEPEKKKAKSKKDWIESQTFQNADDAKAFIKQQSTWSIYTTNTVKLGKKVIYRCVNVKLREKQCDASICLFYPSNKAEVTLYTTSSQHTCQQKENRMSEATKAVIEQLFKDGFKTRKAIQCKLAAANILLPPKNQLNNFISKLNIEHFGVSSISLGELEVFLRDHSLIPDDENEAFIVDHSCDDSKDGDFKFFVTTKTLLRNAVDCEIVSADTTYKMTWQGFPISPVGTIDKDRKFHLFGTLVSKDEKTDDFRFAFNACKDAVRNLYQHDMNPKLLISEVESGISEWC